MMKTDATSRPDALPDDDVALKAMVIASEEKRRAPEETLRALRSSQAEEIERLPGIIAVLRRGTFGSKSEKIDPDRLRLALGEIEAVAAAADGSAERNSEAPADKPAGKRKRRAGNRGSPPKRLPRVVRRIEPENRKCPCGCDMRRIGTEVSERLGVIPAVWYVEEIHRSKYACSKRRNDVVQAASPSRPIPGGLPTEGTVAHVPVNKHADHLPLCRRERIFRRMGVNLDRSTPCAWVKRGAFELRPVFEVPVAHLPGSTEPFMDETRVPVLAPGKKKTKTGWFRAVKRDDAPRNGRAPPGVVFFHAEGRSGDDVVRMMKDFKGILRVDGCKAYDRLTDENEEVRPAFRRAHARRRFEKLLRGSVPAPIAAEAVRRIAELYRIERKIRSRDAEKRLEARREESKPPVEDPKAWAERQRTRVSAKSGLGQAFDHLLDHWDGLVEFLSDGRVEMDSNSVEDSIRLVVVTRRNALFAGHAEGAANWGIVASPIETCKLNGVDPFEWPVDAFAAIVGEWPQDGIEDLLPWNHVHRGMDASQADPKAILAAIAATEAEKDAA